MILSSLVLSRAGDGRHLAGKEVYALFRENSSILSSHKSMSSISARRHPHEKGRRLPDDKKEESQERAGSPGSRRAGPRKSRPAMLCLVATCAAGSRRSGYPTREAARPPAEGWQGHRYSEC